eukprot:COSAG01_NODE_48213_length_383_cov_0.830986_1_plen_64_part_10
MYCEHVVTSVVVGSGHRGKQVCGESVEATLRSHPCNVPAPPGRGVINDPSAARARRPNEPANRR